MTTLIHCVNKHHMNYVYCVPCMILTFLAGYSLETEMLLVSKDKAKFSLLSENNFQM